MRNLCFLLMFFLPACKSGQNGLFTSLVGKTDVEIVLSDYKLDSVPSEIGKLKGVKKLYITADTVHGWKIYPPLSALGEQIVDGSFKRLPPEITELTSLTSLTLVGLDLKTLPDSIGRLANLDTLILYQNRLTISNELSKLKRLGNLKYLGILGNNISSADLIELTESNPRLTINPGLR